MTMVRTTDGEGSQFFRDGIVYREWGYWLAKLEKYPIAEVYFKKAIQQGQDDDLRTYLGLGKMQLDYARFTRAVKTTAKCMQIDPTYSYVKHMQMLSLFHIGEFEYSLVHAHQGYQKHRITSLEHGILQGRETIEDCVGMNTAPNTLLLITPWIEELQKYRQWLAEKLKEEVDELAGIEAEQTKFKVNDPEARPAAKLRKLHHVFAQIYLGDLAEDKAFLRYLCENPEKLETLKKERTEHIRFVITRNYRRAVRRQSILRLRRPFYVMIIKRRALPASFKVLLEAERRLKRNVIIIHADFLLRRLHEFRVKKDYITFFAMVYRVVDKFDSYSLKMFPMKEKCLNAVYNMVAWTYIDTRDLTKIRSKQLRRISLKHHLGIRVAELPRDSDIGWIKHLNGKDTLKNFRKRLAMASEPLELAWLFHELCRYLIDIRRYDLARFFGKKARDMAEKAGSEPWILNAQHLFLRIEVSQNYRNEAKEAGLLALSCAKKLGIDFLVHFYKHAIGIIDRMDMEKLMDIDAIAARQQLIMNLMLDEFKPELDFLWRRMEAVPAKRRMSVMPGCKPVDRKFKLPCMRRSIMPCGPKRPEVEARKALLQQYEPSKERPGFVDFYAFE